MMKTIFSFLYLALFISLIGTIGCKKDDPDNNLTVSLDKTSYHPNELASLNTNDLALTKQEYTANLNGTAFSITNINGSLVFPMPELPAGNYTFTLLVGDKEYITSCSIIALSPIADADAVIQTAIDENLLFTNKLFSLADSLEPNNKTAFKTDLLLLQAFLDSVQNNYLSLSASDKMACAQFLSANKGWMLEVHDAVNNLIVANSTFKNNDAVEDYETRVDAAIVNYTAARIKLGLHVKKIIFLSAAGFAIGSAVPIIGNIVGLKVGAAIGVGFLLLDLKATLLAQDDLLNTSLAPYQELLPEKTATVTQFTKDQKRILEVKMKYRSLYNADKTSSVPAINTFVTDCDLVLALWNEVKQYIPFTFTFNSKTVDDIASFNTTTKYVNSKYLTLDALSNSNVQLTNIDKTDGYLGVTFSNSTSSAQAFNFNLNYTNSRFGSQTTYLEAEVSAGASVSLLDSNLIGNWICTDWQRKDYLGIYQNYLSRTTTYNTAQDEVVCQNTAIYPEKICVSTYTINNYSISFSAIPASVFGSYQATYNFSETDVECTTDVNGQWKPCDPIQLPPKNININHSNARFTSNVTQLHFRIYSSQNQSMESGTYVWLNANQFKLTPSPSDYLIFTKQ